MIIVRHEKYGWLLPSVWFAHKQPQLHRMHVGLWLRSLTAPPEEIVSSKYAVVYQSTQRTLITALDEEEQFLFARMNSTTRRDIRRAEDLLETDTGWQYCPPGNITEEQALVVQSFLNTKRLDPWYARHGIIGSPLSPYFRASSIRDGHKERIVHVYLVDGEEGVVFLYWSASVSFTELERDLQGKLNRWHHWQDILWFKRKGFRLYDWGGAGEEPEFINITRFKESFGGEPFIRYHALVCSRHLAPIWRILVSIQQKRKGR